MGLTNALLKVEQCFTYGFQEDSGKTLKHAWSKGQHVHTVVVDTGCESESLGSREDLGTSFHSRHHIPG